MQTAVAIGQRQKIRDGRRDSQDHVDQQPSHEPLWAGTALDFNLSFPYITGAVIMLISFVASLYFLPDGKESAAKSASAD